MYTPRACVIWRLLLLLLPIADRENRATSVRRGSWVYVHKIRRASRRALGMLNYLNARQYVKAVAGVGLGGEERREVGFCGFGSEYGTELKKTQ